MTARTRSARGPLKVMRVSPHFRDYVLDQLADLRGLRAQAMFGGVGLYAEDVFFGLVAADMLYFKVDDSTRSYYEAAGSKPFKPYADQPTTMSYYEVPIGVVESTSTLLQWARQAVNVAHSSKKKKPATRVRPKL